jgi:predicted ATPase/DNA-binding winged helix-turn-helix (wHTH) protein
VSGRARETIHRFGRLEVDLGRRELRADGVPVPLGGRAFDILEALVESPGELIGKPELARRVWSIATIDDNVLQVHISAIRKALGPDRALIKTTSGRGYRLLGAWTADRSDTADELGDAAPPEAAPGVAPGNLPAAVTELIGREDAARQVAGLVSQHRIVSLVGPGGIGKTRLGIAVVHAVQADFADGAWLVDLSSISDPRLLPSALASVLRLNLDGADITPARVARAIAGRQFLILLDNCERLIDMAAQVAEEIIRRCPRVSVLATSQEALRVEAEAVYRVPPLGVPSDGIITPEDILRHGAVQLFLARAQPAETFIEGQPAMLATVAAICRRLDGVPLAIELAAARASILGIDETERRLDDRFRLLTAGRRTAPPRQQTLLATLDWSHDLLVETERIVLRRLALFAGGFTLAAAASVAAGPDQDGVAVIDAITSLAEKSLITSQTLQGQIRYRLLETIRAYALEKLAASGEAEATAQRHAEYFADMLDRLSRDWAGLPVTDWLATCRREIDNIRAALDWAFSPRGDAAIAVGLTIRSIQPMYDLSLVGECHRRAEAALQLIGTGMLADPDAQMHLLTALQATRIYTEGPSEAAFDAWRTVLALAQELRDAEVQARALWGLWNDHLYSGAPTVAMTYARQFTDLAIARGDTAKEIMGRRIIGVTFHYSGDQIAARTHLEDALARYVRPVHRWQTLGGRLDQATVIRPTLARVLWLQGKPDQAMRLTEAAVSDAFADDHLIATLYVLVEAAIPLSLLAGDFAATARFLDILLERAERSGFGIWSIYGRCFQELLRMQRGDRDAGLPRYRAAVRALRESGFCAHLTMFLGGLAYGLGMAGEVEQAMAVVDEALAWRDHHQDRWYSVELLRIKARIILREGMEDAAIVAETILRQAMEEANRQGAMFWELRAATTLARLLQKENRLREARACLGTVYERFSEGHDLRDLTTASKVLAGL